MQSSISELDSFEGRLGGYRALQRAIEGRERNSGRMYVKSSRYTVQSELEYAREFPFWRLLQFSKTCLRRSRRPCMQLFDAAVHARHFLREARWRLLHVLDTPARYGPEIMHWFIVKASFEGNTKKSLSQLISYVQPNLERFLPNH